MPRHYDADYREPVTLRDGTSIELRAVGPADREILRAGFERLSPESRYLRFFTTKKHLTDDELTYLTELDGERHYAIGAVREAGDRIEGLGVARFIRASDDAPNAEAAIAVADEIAGRGLGKILLTHLAAAARERGIEAFTLDVLDRNTKMRQLLEELGGAKTKSREPGVVHLVYPLPEAGNDDSAGYRLLKIAAEHDLPLKH